MVEPQTPQEMHNARMERLRKLRQVPTVRVVPKDDNMRALLKHPKAGAFPPEGGSEWPDDNFTRRRLRDGDVVVEEEANATH